MNHPRKIWLACLSCHIRRLQKLYLQGKSSLVVPQRPTEQLQPRLSSVFGLGISIHAGAAFAPLSKDFFKRAIVNGIDAYAVVPAEVRSAQTLPAAHLRF